jgi:FdhD protein
MHRDRPIWKWSAAGPPRREADELAVEEPLEVRIRGRSIGLTMRTPGHDEELVAGMLLAEGVVRGPRDLLRIEHCAREEEDNVVNVVLAPAVRVDPDRLSRALLTSSSCGVCGRATIEATHGRSPPIDGPMLRISAAVLASLPQRLADRQATFRRTGGLHAAAIFDASGAILIAREDIGRHNAVDKALGHGLLHGLLPFDRHILMVSGRASFEIMQKALAARVPVVAAVSAPSSLAVEFAEASRQTLLGFVRQGRFNVYAHPEPIVFEGPGAG